MKIHTLFMLSALCVTSACIDPESLPTLKMLDPETPTTDTTSLISQGYELLDKKKPTEALELFDNAIKADEKNVRALQGKGLALNYLSRPEEAEASYEKALMLEPSSVSVANNLAMSYILRGQYESAAKLLKPLQEKNPNHRKLEENLALSYCLMGKKEAAKTLYSKHLLPKQVDDNLKTCGKIRK